MFLSGGQHKATNVLPKSAFFFPHHLMHVSREIERENLGVSMPCLSRHLGERRACMQNAREAWSFILSLSFAFSLHVCMSVMFLLLLLLELDLDCYFPCLLCRGKGGRQGTAHVSHRISVWRSSLLAFSVRVVSVEGSEAEGETEARKRWMNVHSSFQIQRRSLPLPFSFSSRQEKVFQKVRRETPRPTVQIRGKAWPEWSL